MSHTRSRIRWLATAAVALLSLAACADKENNGGLPTNAEAGLYPQISVSGDRASTKAELALRQIPGGVTFASYQGEVIFDPAVLTLKDVALPEGVDGAAHLVSPGHIRFAGTALDGTVGAPLLRMTFSASAEVRREAFSVRFEEVADAEFSDVTGQVQSGYLIFQR
ncbi:MAG TPA: hypothetical protein VFS20_10760 [Longimicrobium sp.]|nr:hypothetical protein [Longimicrobium sp.]